MGIRTDGVMDCTWVQGNFGHGYRVLIELQYRHHAQMMIFYLQDGASEIPNNEPVLSVDDLADQVAEVLDHFK